MAFTLADLLAPMDPARFLAEFNDKQPLHIKGGAAKFAHVLSWAGIDRLLNQTHIWSSQSLKLQMDTQPVPPEAYCIRATGRDNTPVMQPEAGRLREWVAKGASVVLNDVDSLTPGLTSVSEALENAGFGRAQANVYISFQAHKAFPTHFDTHDVWAVQVEGEKTWNIWSGRADYPIPHPAFRSLGQAHHERARGTLREKVLLKAGDLLYLPRGWYHDALAEGPASVHVAYGVHAPIGLDLANMLAERALQDPMFRQPLPRQDGTPAAQFALTSRAAQLGQRLAELARDPQVLQVLARHVADARYHRGGVNLLAARGLAPEAPAEDAPADGAPGFRVIAPGAKPVRRGTEWVLKTAGATLPLTAPEAEAANWLLARREVDAASLQAAHPAVDAPSLLQRLTEAGALASL
ncbi:Ribosomal protein L16 Arg81 hydroxylase, contains JmjC domain [Roseomonas rosea]|uniref:Ribosomal protein L16 Arg81 hydroxylase, contains JmjC domain n=1 Tax=Muricoccus roseus TaxID=198092 RepID=A0A1M6DFP2_9PROT|nr:cupin domain-containing protein [Roseomonas rosea]SHI72167.1 Ribosomal protein L16 Arg81 hydroxylase, contains JmjC domain [Roseomonas rosea]